MKQIEEQKESKEFYMKELAIAGRDEDILKIGLLLSSGEVSIEETIEEIKHQQDIQERSMTEILSDDPNIFYEEFSEFYEEGRESYDGRDFNDAQEFLERFKYIEENIRGLEEENENLKTQNQGLETNLKSASVEILKLKKQIKELSKENLESPNQDLKTKNQELETENQALKKELKIANGKIQNIEKIKKIIDNLDVNEKAIKEVKGKQM